MAPAALNGRSLLNSHDEALAQDWDYGVVQCSIGLSGLLGDTTARDYARKLRYFSSFAAPELRGAIASLGIRPGMNILDAGCGTGEAMGWLLAAAMPGGFVAGFDLAAAHCSIAQTIAPPHSAVLQADLMRPPLSDASFDLVWSVNTINHLRNPLLGVETLARLARKTGLIAIGQSSFIPDMVFAWDARLEHLVNEGVRCYYRERYGLQERSLTGIRSVVGLLRRAQLANVSARTFMIERISPLAAADEAYLLEAIFRGTWGERLRPHLSAADFEEVTRLCDPEHEDFALHRKDFHFLQSFTLVVGEKA